MASAPATTTQKHKSFVREPIGMSTPVIKVPGIGPAAAGRLKDINITLARQLYGTFLSYVSLEPSEKGQKLSLFEDWLLHTTGLGERHVRQCSTALFEHAARVLGDK